MIVNITIQITNIYIFETESEIAIKLMNGATITKREKVGNPAQNKSGSKNAPKTRLVPKSGCSLINIIGTDTIIKDIIISFLLF